MTFTVTPQPDNVPPRVRIDIDADDPAKSFTSLTIYRDGKPIREQPFVGGSVSVVFDYEAPFGVASHYSVEGGTATWASAFATAWPNLTGWTTTTGSPVTTGGYLASSGGVASTVTRTVGLNSPGRLTVGRLGVSGGAGAASLTLGGELAVTYATGTTPHHVQLAGVIKAVTHTSGSMVIQWDDATVTITTPQGSWQFDRGWTPPSGVVTAFVSPFGVVPGFTIEDQSGSTPFVGSASATLEVTDAWLIHPSQPSLSIPINSGNGSGTRFIEASSGSSRSSAAQSTIHRPIGRRRAVVVTSGPRQADEWTLVISADDSEARNSVRSIVDDQTPLLLRLPLSMSGDIPDDWYSVGDVEISRPTSPFLNELTLITLPLTPVDEPIVRQGALWTWGDVLLRYATWADLMADNDTWLDVIAGPTS